MAICSGCGKNVIVPIGILGNKVCMKCAKALKKREWDGVILETNDDVVKMKNKVLSSADNAGIKGDLIQTVSNYFDSQIEDGLLYRVDGGEEQIIKVYENHCLIITSEEFDESETSKRYAKSLKKGISLKSILSDEAVVKAVASGLILKRGLAKNGMAVASSIAVNSVLQNCFPGKADISVLQGVKRINYSDCEDIQLLKYDSEREDCIGAIVFLLKSTKEYQFFFSDKEESVARVCAKMDELVCKTKNTESIKENVVGSNTVADEILKFKQLLDMGALTQEEFDIKKKQLLNM